MVYLWGMKHTTTLPLALFALLLCACQKEEEQPPAPLDPGPYQYGYEVYSQSLQGQYITVFVNGTKRDSLVNDGSTYVAQGIVNAGDTLLVRTRLSAPDTTPGDTAYARVALVKGVVDVGTLYIHAQDAVWQQQTWVAGEGEWQ